MAPATSDRARQNRQEAQVSDRPIATRTTRYALGSAGATPPIPLSESPFASSTRLKLAPQAPQNAVAVAARVDAPSPRTAEPATTQSPDFTTSQPDSLDEEAPPAVRPVASWGWRGVVNTLPGVALRAGRLETTFTVDAEAARRASPTRTAQIAVVGDEGGCGRTWLTFALAAALAAARRGGVIAWDGTRRGGPLAMLGDGGGAGLESLTTTIHQPETVAAMSALTSRQDSAAEVLGWGRPTHAPLTRADVEMIRRSAARFYGVSVADTDADPWGDVWEAIVATSAAVVVIHSGSRWSDDSVARTVARVREVTPSAHIVGAALSKQAPPESVGLSWTRINRPPNLASWSRTSHRHQADLMGLARSVTSSFNTTQGNL